MYFFETILSALAYLFQIVMFLLAAGIVPLLLYLWTKKKKAALVLFAILLIMEGAAVVKLCKRPIWHCPRQYEAYVSDEDKERVLSLSSGLFSPRIPVFPLSVTVEEADSCHNIHARIQYLFFGYSLIELSDDGPNSTGLFGD